jgi:hypothetical protein
MLHCQDSGGLIDFTDDGGLASIKTQPIACLSTVQSILDALPLSDGWIVSRFAWFFSCWPSRHQIQERDVLASIRIQDSRERPRECAG